MSNALRDAFGIFSVGAWQEDPKLVATDPTDYVAASHRLTDYFGNGAQRVISGATSNAIVECPQVVYVYY